MSPYKLTTFAKICIFVLILAIGAGAVAWMNSAGFIKMPQKAITTTTQTNQSAPANVNVPLDSSAMKISLDEWIGWKPILDANGGLNTAKGSIYDKLGLKLNIAIINDANQSSSAFINKSIDGAGYTINRMAFLAPKFMDNKSSFKMVYITNNSSGGDGIIAKKDITSIEGLVGKKIGIPRFSEAQTLFEYLIVKSSLTPEQKKAIVQVPFNTPDDAAKAFYAGQVDAAATWQPYLSQITSSDHILLSTKSANNLILDGIIFRDDYLAANKENVLKFIEGALKAETLYTQDIKVLKNSMPLFGGLSDDEVKGSLGDATLANVSKNVELFGGMNQMVFKDMANIWKSIGEDGRPELSDKIFDGSYVSQLINKLPQVTTPVVVVSEESKAKAKSVDTALLKQVLTINFKPNSDEFTDKDAAYTTLSKVIETAKVLDNTILQIEGNVADDANSDYNQKLSEQRAKAVSTYLKFNGINPSRFVVIGNGANKPVAPNDTSANMAKNRRTDVIFKAVD